MINTISYSGEITYNGLNLKENNDFVSLISQEIILCDNLSVKDNIINILKLFGNEIDLNQITFLLNEF